jgi:hypothetical protein
MKRLSGISARRKRGRGEKIAAAESFFGDGNNSPDRRGGAVHLKKELLVSVVGVSR